MKHASIMLFMLICVAHCWCKKYDEST